MHGEVEMTVVVVLEKAGRGRKAPRALERPRNPSERAPWSTLADLHVARGWNRIPR